MIAKITDLGMSPIFDPDPANDYVSMTVCPGNMIYMPPELQTREKYRGTNDNFDKLDVFSFGVFILHVCR